MSAKDELLGIGVLSLLLNPYILLALALVFIGVFLGLFAIVYLTLQSYHLMTAVIFLVSALVMFYIAAKSGVITKEISKKYPWMWLLIPGAFVFGYVAENVGNLVFTVAPLAIASDQQATANFMALFILVIGALYILGELLESHPKKAKK